MDSGRGKEKELAKQLISLDLDEGIRIEQKSQGKKLFINRNACGNFVVQFVLIQRTKIVKLIIYNTLRQTLKY